MTSTQRWLRRAARAGAVACGVAMLCILGALALLGTATGRDAAARLAERALSDDRVDVRIAGISGSLFSEFRIAEVAVTGRDGGAVAAEAVRIAWRPASLFRRILDLRAVTVRRIAVDGIPDLGAAEGNSGGLGLPLSIRVSQLKVDDLELGRAVLGETQHFALSGAMDLGEQLSHGHASARLVRKGGAAGHAEIAIRYGTQPAQFDARVDIAEPEGGPVARFAGLPADKPLRVRLNGAGPPDNWRGRLEARAGDLAQLAAGMTLSLDEAGLHLVLDGTAEIAPLLPQAARRMAAPRIDIGGSFDYGADGTLAVRELVLRSPAVQVTASGRYAAAQDRIEGTLSARMHDAAALSDLAPALRLDDTRLQASIGGSTANPVVEASLRGRSLSLAVLAAESVTGEMRLGRSSPESFAVSGRVRLSGVRPAASIPAGLLGPTVGLQIDGRIGIDGTLPRLGLELTSAAAALEVDAAMNRQGILSGRYALRHDALAALLPEIATDGQLTASGAFHSELTSGRTRAGIAGAVSGFAAASPWIGAALGNRIALSASVDWNGADTLSVSGIEAAGQSARLDGHATIDPAAEQIDAQYSLSLASLRPLSAPAGVPLAGAASLTGTAKGSLAAPEVRGRLATQGIAIGDNRVGDVTAEVAARPVGPGFEATARLGGEIAGKPLGGEMALSFGRDTVLVEQVALSLGRNRVAGDLTLDTARSRLGGALTATLRDLADLPPVAGLPSFARGKAIVRLDLRGGTPESLAIDAEADGIAIDDGRPTGLSLAHATAAVVLRDPFGAASIDGKLDLAGLRAGAAAVESASLGASGTLSALDWTMTAEGRQPLSASLSAAGSLSVAGDRGTATVTRLRGTLETQEIRLRAPASIGWSPRGFRADTMDLAVAGGGLRLSAKQEADSIEATAAADALPVALAALIEPRLDLAGSVSGQLRLAGQIRRPSIDLALSAAGVRPHDMRQADFAGLSLTADLRQDADTTHLRLTAKGPQDTTATADLSGPPIVSLRPFRMDLPREARIGGRIEAVGRLELLARIVGLGADRLGGGIAATARLSGTPARPELRGEMELAEGTYENAVTGTVIRDASARVTFTGHEARLVSFSAGDGGSGRLSGSGTVSLGSPSAEIPSLTVRLDRFTALHRPEADVVATGTLALRGSLQAPELAGKLSVDHAELRIPDRLPEEVVELDVIEINGPEPATPPAGSRPAETSLARGLALALDVDVAFPGRAFLRGRGLDSEWHGDLLLSGTTAEPTIAGKLSVVRGSFAFAGKTFTLESGSVSFPGGGAAEPELAAVAVARLDEILAQVRLAGQASRPTITVSSEPPLPQEEVLSRILFGRSTGQLSPLQAARLAHTAATLSGAVGGAGIIDRVRQTLGVDVLDVDAGSEGGATLKAGKYLSDDVFVSVTQGTEPGSQKVGVEVDVLPNLSIESDISGDASSNLGINWKFDY